MTKKKTTLGCFYLALILFAGIPAMGDDPNISSELRVKNGVVICGQLNIYVHSKYTIKSDWVHYTEQKASIDTGEGKRDYKLDNNQLHVEQNQYGEQDFGVLVAYKCATGKNNKKYAVLYYSVGGNCELCEWADVIDLKGNLMITNNNMTDKAFKKACLRLGLKDIYNNGKWIWLEKQ